MTPLILGTGYLNIIQNNFEIVIRVLTYHYSLLL